MCAFVLLARSWLSHRYGFPSTILYGLSKTVGRRFFFSSFAVAPRMQIGLFALNFLWGATVGMFSNQSVAKQLSKPEQCVWLMWRVRIDEAFGANKFQEKVVSLWAVLQPFVSRFRACLETVVLAMCENEAGSIPQQKAEALF